MDIGAYKDAYYGNRIFGLNPTPGVWSSAKTTMNNGLVGTRPQFTNPIYDVDAPDLSFLDVNQDKLNKKLAFKNSKIGSILSGALGAASGILGGPMGWAGLAISAIGDNIRAAKSQFDLNGFNDQLNDAQSDYLQAAGSANTTSDLVNLHTMKPDLGSYIDNQGYDWDGNILGGIGALIGNARTERDKATARGMLSDMEDRFSYGMQNALQRVNNNTYRFGMANFLNNAAMGGPLSTHGSDFTDDLIRIDAGGSHEQNPLGGVPAGIDPNGIPNLVEEGETIWDDYVFSKRLKVSKGLAKEFKLGGGKKGLSYSDAARRISEKSGATLRPNDPISKRTKDAMLGELEQEQEEKRMNIQRKQILSALQNMSPEEFQTMFTQQPAPMDVGTMAPPQGLEEEPLMQEPVQGDGMYEPVGFALGGHILDGKHGESWRVVSPLAGPQRLPGVGVIGYPDRYDKEVKIEQDDKGQWWVEGRMVGKGRNGEAAAQRYARQIANIRATQNMSGDLGGISSVQTERKTMPTPKSSAKTTNYSIERPDNVLSTPYLNADLSGFVREQAMPDRHGTVNPDEVYDAWGVGRFLPDDYASFFGRIHAPGYKRTPGWSVLAPDASPSDAVQEAPPTQKANSAGSGRGTMRRAGVLSTPAMPDLGTVEMPDLPEGIPASDTIVINDKPIVVPALSNSKNTRQQLDMLPTWMRYAPIIGSGISVLGNLFDNPDYSEYEGLIRDARRLGNPISIPVETIGNRLRRNPVDERLAVNQANQNFLASIRGTQDISGGNRAYRQFANNLLAYNNQGALSDIATKAYLANRQDALQTADFNRGTDMYNANAINQRNLTQAQLNSNRQQAGFNALLGTTQALDNARRYDSQFVDADLTGLLEGLGRLGKENASMNMIRSLANEGVLNFAIGRNGEVGFIPGSGYGVMKKGGKIKTKKRRF